VENDHYYSDELSYHSLTVLRPVRKLLLVECCVELRGDWEQTVAMGVYESPSLSLPSQSVVLGI